MKDQIGTMRRDQILMESNDSLADGRLDNYPRKLAAQFNGKPGITKKSGRRQTITDVEMPDNDGNMRVVYSITAKVTLRGKGSTLTLTPKVNADKVGNKARVLQLRASTDPTRTDDFDLEDIQGLERWIETVDTGIVPDDNRHATRLRAMNAALRAPVPNDEADAPTDAIPVVSTNGQAPVKEDAITRLS